MRSNQDQDGGDSLPVPLQDEEINLNYGEFVSEKNLSQYLAMTHQPMIYIDGIKVSTISFAHDWFRLVAVDDQTVVSYESNKGWAKSIKKQDSSAGGGEVRYVTFIDDGFTLTCDTTFESLKASSDKPIIGILIELDRSSNSILYSTKTFIGNRRCEFQFIDGLWEFESSPLEPTSYQVHPTFITLLSDLIVLDRGICQSISLAAFNHIDEDLGKEDLGVGDDGDDGGIGGFAGK